jgi:hypothetical protein
MRTIPEFSDRDQASRKNGEVRKMIPVEVCHFTKRNIAIKHILPEKRLRLGMIKFTNDPKESLFRTGGYTRKENDGLDPITIDQYFAESMRIHDEEWKVMCFTASRALPDDGAAPRFPKDIFETIRQWKEVELPGYNHPLMWDHYAERHEGVCLVFDGVKLDQIIHKELGVGCKIFSGMVRYFDLESARGSLLGLDASDVITLGPTEAARKHFFTHFEHYFLNKNLDWERETEFRWLVHSMKKEPEYIPIAGALKGVIVGMNFPREDEQTIKSLSRELSVPAGKMGWVSGLPSIDFDYFSKQ